MLAALGHAHVWQYPWALYCLAVELANEEGGG